MLLVTARPARGPALALKGRTMATAAAVPAHPAAANPPTAPSPVTGKVQGPPRKPLPASGNGTLPANLKGVSQPAGTARPATRKPQPKATPARPQPKATATRKQGNGRSLAAPARPAPAARPAKATPASRALPRQLVTQVAALYAKASPVDQQRVANYLKVVTTGTAACGCRWWPAGKGTLPRPTHFSWAPCGQPGHAAANKP